MIDFKESNKQKALCNSNDDCLNLGLIMNTWNGLEWFYF